MRYLHVDGFPEHGIGRDTIYHRKMSIRQRYYSLYGTF